MVHKRTGQIPFCSERFLTRCSEFCGSRTEYTPKTYQYRKSRHEYEGVCLEEIVMLKAAGRQATNTVEQPQVTSFQWRWRQEYGQWAEIYRTSSVQVTQLDQ